MEFQVEFRSYGVVAENIGSYGLDIVDVVREEMKIPDLSIDKISTERQTCYNALSLLLSEEEARSTELFSGRNSLTVYIRSGFLTKYREWKVGKVRKSDEKFRWPWQPVPIWYVEVEDKLNKKAIISAWIKDGCPEYWGVTEEEYWVLDKNDENM
jgi:hypothetical protein